MPTAPRGTPHRVSQHHTVVVAAGRRPAQNSHLAREPRQVDRAFGMRPRDDQHCLLNSRLVHQGNVLFQREDDVLMAVEHRRRCIEGHLRHADPTPKIILRFDVAPR